MVASSVLTIHSRGCFVVLYEALEKNGELKLRATLEAID